MTTEPAAVLSLFRRFFPFGSGSLATLSSFFFLPREHEFAAFPLRNRKVPACRSKRRSKREGGGYAFFAVVVSRASSKKGFLCFSFLLLATMACTFTRIRTLSSEAFDVSIRHIFLGREPKSHSCLKGTSRNSNSHIFFIQEHKLGAPLICSLFQKVKSALVF